MELQAARKIIDTLAQGIHPVTGEVMPEDSPYNAPPVIRALFAVSQALEGDKPAVPKAPRREAPSNAGKPWHPHEDEKLDAAFAAGIEVKQMAEELGRTPFAVQSRLVKLGKLPPQPGMRFMANGKSMDAGSSPA
jgi:hypothetical protein